MRRSVLDDPVAASTAPAGVDDPTSNLPANLAAEFRDVEKSFAETRAVDAISFSIPAGAVYGVIGPNGAGKTTTIRMLMGILKPDAGHINVLGETDPSLVKHRVGYLPEEKGLYKKMRVLELATYFGRLKGLDKATAEARARTLLARFDLADRLSDKCETLSKGMGQKVQIVATLAHEPELVVLDEPFSGLDPVNVELVRNTILELKAAGKTIVFSTHIMEQAEQICDSIMLINRGRKLIDGPMGTIRANTGNTVVIDYEGDGARIANLPGIVRINDAGQRAEITLAPNADANELLTEIVKHVRVRRFDNTETSLHEVFIRAIGADADPTPPS